MSDRYDLTEVQWPTVPFDLMKHAILIGKRGSEAHGTYQAPATPDAIDDRDIMGICIPPIDYYFGTKQWEGQDSFKGCWDVVLYSFQKAVKLLSGQNPNMITMLWMRPEDYLHISPEGQELLNNRNLFRGRERAFSSFVGYANAQLHRMTHHNPYRGYMGAKRKLLVDKHGYDTKNAAHLVRLLKMGKEYMETGELTVYRAQDRQELIDIKTGKWDLTDVKLYAEKLFEQVKVAADSSPLPAKPDEEAINELAVRLTRSFFGRIYGHQNE